MAYHQLKRERAETELDKIMEKAREAKISISLADQYAVLNR